MTSLVLPLASARRRSVHALTLALAPLSIAANEVCISRRATLRRSRRSLEHLRLSGRVLVFRVFVFVFVAILAVAGAVATARSSSLVLVFLGAGFSCEGELLARGRWR